MSVTLNYNYLSNFILPQEFEAITEQVSSAHKMLHEKKGLGKDFTGWLTLPTDYNKQEFNNIKMVAEQIKSNTDIFIVIGIGGSYLGARAVIEIIKSRSYNSLPKNTPDIYFIGNSLSSTDLAELLKICENKNISINMISKSGTTLEPALAFRAFRKLLETKYGKEEAKNRIFCTTDKSKGTLKQLADREGYKTFVVPDDIGGRYSVLTAVGLLPIAVAGIDIDELMSGARQAQNDLSCSDINKNDCYRYAAIRNILYRKGKNIEILVSYEPSFAMMNEWFKQLFGESEGKNNKGIFPASVIFSTDLHSMGQYIQDGRRDLFETIVNFEKSKESIIVEKLEEDIDDLNFLAGQSMHFINKNAFLGTVIAHTEGHVPNIILNIPEINPGEIGYLIYFFEKACAISGYILGVNPFDQSGVETYKKNMFTLLGKSGNEEEKNSLLEKLK